MGVVIFLNKTLPNDAESQFKPHLGSGQQTRGRDATSTMQVAATSVVTRVAKAPDPEPEPTTTDFAPGWTLGCEIGVPGCGSGATTDPFVPLTVTTVFDPASTGMTGLPMVPLPPDPLPSCAVSILCHALPGPSKRCLLTLTNSGSLSCRGLCGGLPPRSVELHLRIRPE